MIDLRSDTVTIPTPKMLEAMSNANVGDDVIGEDKTVNTFQKKIADIFGMESGLFVPSGVMNNQLALKVLTQPGDEILIDKNGHIYNYETGGAAFLSGVQFQTVSGVNGKLNSNMLVNRKRGAYDWEAKTTVLCLENTTNKGGGACYTREELIELKDFADSQQLLIHIDGARIWNAITTTNIEPTFFSQIADTISVCFSKGLGAPIGSMLLSSKEHIAQARRFRKMWGGGMRQVGLLAAAADFAVENHWPLMEEDHKKAKIFADTVAQCSKLEINVDPIESNILMFDVNDGDAEQAVALLEKKEYI
jgi:threonine aldolase